jgi:hypothetical protein
VDEILPSSSARRNSGDTSQDDGESKSKDSRKSDATDELLDQIRQDFIYCKSYWNENYEKAAKCMDCIAAIPPKEFSDDRANRPIIWPDETTQYVNQANNNLRQNSRSIKLDPREEGTDEDAEHRMAYIEGIQDASGAKAIYETAYESAVQCAFGFFRLVIIHTGKNKFEPRLRRIPNYATVYDDPDAREADFSDASIKFVVDTMRESVFKRKFPKAQKTSFTASDREAAPDWLTGGNVVVAEYWRRVEKETEDGEKLYTVYQYLTNGVELLKPDNWSEDSEDSKDEKGRPCTKWIGSWIPIIGVFGKEIYIKNGGQSKRMFLSMIHNGLPAQQMLAYYASQEAEEVAQMPRSAIMALKGSLTNVDSTWKIAHKSPMAYLEYGIPKDWNAQWGPPPKPARAPFTPNYEAYEVGYERWRRVLQASVAGSPLPTDAQRVNDKSGVALEKITDAGLLGNFHFTSNFTRALRNAGEQINELITKLAERESLPEKLHGKNKEGKAITLHLVKEQAPPESSEMLPESNFHFFAHRGKFTVTISDGPNHASEREAESDFADTLWETTAKLGLPPQITMQILSIATRMKNLGAQADKLAEILNPTDQTQMQLQQAQQQLQEMQKQAADMAQELQEMKLREHGKVIDNEYKSQIKKLELNMQGQIAQLNADLKAYIANVQTKSQNAIERGKLFQETQTENHHAAHDLALQKDQQAHEHSIADKQAVIAQAQAEQAANSSQPSASDAAPQ